MDKKFIKWRRVIFFLFGLAIIMGAWHLTVVSRTMQAADQARKKSVCRIERAPEFYELDKVEVGSYLYIEGLKQSLSEFVEKPALVLLDGCESRLWMADDLDIVGGFSAGIFETENPWPGEETDVLRIRLTGTGQPLKSRPWRLSGILQNFAGKLAFGEYGGNLNRRYLLVTTAVNLIEPSTFPREENLQAKIEQFFQQPAFLIDNCIAIHKLQRQEFRPEKNWHKDNLFGTPALISSHFEAATLLQIKRILADLNQKLPFAKLVGTFTKSELSLVFLKESEDSNALAHGYFSFSNGLTGITMWIDENRPIQDSTRILLHEYYHALSYIGNNNERPLRTNESVLLEESAAEWFSMLCTGEGRGMKYTRRAFKPGHISVWPASAAPGKIGNSYYNMDAFIHWLYLKSDLGQSEFLEKLLAASGEGRFDQILAVAGHSSMNQALPEFMAFCWWMSLASPEEIIEPFNSSFTGLKEKSFFASGSQHDFNSIKWDVDTLDYWKFFPVPGHSYFLKGDINLLKSGWELVTEISEENLMIFMAFLVEGKVLEVRRLKGCSEFGIVRKQLPAQADSWSLWFHYRLPENEECAAADDNQRREEIMEMFKSGRAAVTGSQ